MEIPTWIQSDLRSVENTKHFTEEQMLSCLKAGERLDDLLRDGYRIIQNPEKFCFGVDAVFLTDFVPEIGTGCRVLDLGTGNGILPILLCAKGKGGSFTGLEIQEEMAEMATRSVLINGMCPKIDIVQGDIREASALFGRGTYDCVVSNPPYMKTQGAIVNENPAKSIARHEILLTLEDVIREAAAVLKTRGYFYIIHRPNRLTELISLMHEYRIEPQRIRFVHPYVDKGANMVMVEGRKDCQAFLKVEQPLIVYDKDTGRLIPDHN